MKTFNKEQNIVKMKKFLFFSLISFNIFSCGQTKFVADANSSLATPVIYESSSKVDSSEIQYIQPNLSENKTTVSFQVKGLNGILLQDLLKTDFRLTENGVPITDLVLNKNSTTHVTTADILFAVDVTGSMTSTIESAKRRIVDFIKNTRAKGYHTRMCLSTFGDYTVKKCVRFYNNDPSDVTTEAEVAELISEVSKLKALKGAEDPGGNDLDENPMRTVIDAALAPWGDDSQRFVILITDAGFLYSPGHSGAVGAIAPIFSDVTNAINQSKIKIFAVTPSLAGYNKNFGPAPGALGIVDQSEGEWYNYSDLVSGKINLNTVLNKILSSIDTTFLVDYTLTSQSSLDPSKPLSERNIVIELFNTALGAIKGLVVTSNLPNGRVADPKRFVIADKKVRDSRLQVYVDGVLQKNNYTLLSSGKEIEFTTPQKPDAKIQIKYQYDAVKDSITLTPIHVPVGVDKIPLLKFSINGIPVDSKYYEAVGIDLNLSSIVLSDDIFGSDDPFKINETEQMNILVKTK